MAAPRKIDYERIEAGWRAGLKSPEQLAAEYTRETGVSVTYVAINKHFKKLGVPRDLKAKIKAKADEMVLKAMVSAKVSAKVLLAGEKRDKEIVDVVAETVAEIRIVHRKDISRHRALTVALLAELESQTADMALSGRVDNLKKLSDTLKTLIGLERQAYDIGEVAAENPGAINIHF